jgi:hypothetical protein
MVERTAKMIESRGDVDVWVGRLSQDRVGSIGAWLEPVARGSTWGAHGSMRGTRSSTPRRQVRGSVDHVPCSIGDWLIGPGD